MYSGSLNSIFYHVVQTFTYHGITWVQYVAVGTSYCLQENEEGKSGIKTIMLNARLRCLFTTNTVMLGDVYNTLKVIARKNYDVVRNIFCSHISISLL